MYVGGRLESCALSLGGSLELVMDADVGHDISERSMREA